MPYTIYLIYLLLALYTPPPVGLGVQELAEDCAATVLLYKVHLYRFLVGGQVYARLGRLPRLQEDNRGHLAAIPPSPAGLLHKVRYLLRCIYIYHLIYKQVVEPDPEGAGGYNRRLLRPAEPPRQDSRLLLLCPRLGYIYRAPQYLPQPADLVSALAVDDNLVLYPIAIGSLPLGPVYLHQLCCNLR